MENTDQSDVKQTTSPKSKLSSLNSTMSSLRTNPDRDMSKSNSNIEEKYLNEKQPAKQQTSKKMQIRTISYEQMMKKLIQIANSYKKNDNIELKHYSSKMESLNHCQDHAKFKCLAPSVTKIKTRIDNNQIQNTFKMNVKSCSTPAIYNMEEEILRSTYPLPTNETEEIEILGYKGMLLNKKEIENYGGDYKLNNDPNPEIPYKVDNRLVEYEQDIQIRNLKPPTPPPPGDLIIKQETNVSVIKPPPVIIRQTPKTIQQTPIIIREVPPQPPAPIPTQVITIKSNQEPVRLPRSVIVEQFLPKPEPIVIEKWLPFKKLPRKIVSQRQVASINVQTQYSNSGCIQPIESNLNYQNEKELESRIQLELNIISKKIYKLKNDLETEKEKTKTLSERMNNMFVLMNYIKRV